MLFRGHCVLSIFFFVLIALTSFDVFASSNRPVNPIEMANIGHKAASSGERTIMPHLRASRAYRLSGVAEMKAFRPSEPSVKPETPPQKDIPALKPLTERNAGQMYKPSLYAETPLVAVPAVTPPVTADTPYVYDATKEPPPPFITGYQAPVVINGAKENVFVLNGGMTPPRETLEHPILGQPPLTTVTSAPRPAPMPAQDMREQKKTEERGFLRWLTDLFDEPALENRARPHLPRTATYTNRDDFYIQAMRNYPGQPFAKYAQHVMRTGVAPNSQAQTNRSSASLTVPMNHSFAFVYRSRIQHKPMFYDDTNEPVVMEQPKVAPDSLPVPTTMDAKTSTDIPLTAAVTDQFIMTEVPKDLGIVAIPFVPQETPKPVTSVTISDRATPALDSFTDKPPVQTGEAPRPLGTTAIPFRREAPRQEDIVASGPGPVDTSADRRWGVFASADMLFGEAKLIRDAQKTDTDATGMTIGVDYRLRDKTSLGLALHYARSHFTTRDASDSEANNYSLSLYGTTDYLNNGYVDGYISVGFSTFDSERTTLAGVNDPRIASGDPTAFFISGQVETGYEIAQGPWTYGPFGGVKMTYVDVESYHEKGADNLNLAVDPSNDISIIGSIGFGGSHHVAAGRESAIVPSFRMALNHEFGDGRIKASGQQLSGSGTKVLAEGVRRTRTWLTINPSIKADLAKNWSAHVQYVRDVFRGGNNENTVNFGASYKW